MQSSADTAQVRDLIPTEERKDAFTAEEGALEIIHQTENTVVSQDYGGLLYNAVK